MKINTLLIIAMSLLVLSSCKPGKGVDIVKTNFDFAAEQLTFAFSEIEAAKNESDTKFSPRTINKKGELELVVPRDWTSGFFPGSLWYMYEYTNDSKWEEAARNFTVPIEPQQYTTSTHDLGFILNNSFGNGLRLTNDESYKPILLQAAKSLISRYKPDAKVIRSWDFSQDKWQCPVIIDNMMNLELLFEASKLSGDSTYRDIAISHADTTMKYQFREDNSCYHVVDYDKIKGGMRSRCTAQGYADESAWARGQAWAIYGYTVCYRETKDPKYLEMAKKVYDFIFTHPNLPSDLVPYWDYDVPEIPNTPRDASAAACTASALYELSEFIPEYKATADKIMDSLTSPAYRAIVGTNGNFLLMHSVGSIPHHTEIDVPLNYADYYFLEAMVRKRALDCNQK